MDKKFRIKNYDVGDIVQNLTYRDAHKEHSVMETTWVNAYNIETVMADGSIGTVAVLQHVSDAGTYLQVTNGMIEEISHSNSPSDLTWVNDLSAGLTPIESDKLEAKQEEISLEEIAKEVSAVIGSEVSEQVTVKVDEKVNNINEKINRVADNSSASLKELAIKAENAESIARVASDMAEKSKYFDKLSAKGIREGSIVSFSGNIENDHGTFTCSLLYILVVVSIKSERVVLKFHDCMDRLTRNAPGGSIFNYYYFNTSLSYFSEVAVLRDLKYLSKIEKISELVQDVNIGDLALDKDGEVYIVSPNTFLRPEYSNILERYETVFFSPEQLLNCWVTFPDGDIAKIVDNNLKKILVSGGYASKGSVEIASLKDGEPFIANSNTFRNITKYQPQVSKLEKNIKEMVSPDEGIRLKRFTISLKNPLDF